ncbi:unnamed protein product [Parascedosporium putredinis]|uniref:Uncharacterized protein n=1 Tax=Parascedosporium putredinis TaxID=1442378 RepID=A0A9P1MCM5_9PEZI|nr:unnamed protein product [Parascedosporium putredinis]CAI7998673.1 unnamed protein product [Parascedosporium putredinis]
MKAEFPKVEHILIVGIVGGMPYYGLDKRQIKLGDVVVDYPEVIKLAMRHRQASSRRAKRSGPEAEYRVPEALQAAVDNLRTTQDVFGTKIPEILAQLRKVLPDTIEPLIASTMRREPGAFYTSWLQQYAH